MPAPEPDLAAERTDYAGTPLTEAEAPVEPFALLQDWLAAAMAAKDEGQLLEPTAVQLATVEVDGGRLRPAVRTVLLKGVDARGLVFFTNTGSAKGRAVAANPDVALHVHWAPLQRAIRVGGVAAELPRAESEAYFATRPRGSQLGAWASPQSEVVPDADTLARAWTAAEQRFDGVEVDCPPYWGGYRVAVESVEFWQGRPSRMHDRLRYRLLDGRWKRERLAP